VPDVEFAINHAWTVCLALMLGLASQTLGCHRSADERTTDRIIVRGSDTMAALSQRWAQVFGARTGVDIEVSGGGSGTGIASLENGTTDLATSSRRMSEQERARIEKQRGPVHEAIVAIDAVIVYVNEENPLRSLTVEQIDQVYRGRTPAWASLGGNAHQIALYSRENSSGTYAFFKEQVLGGHDFAPSTQCLPGTAAVVRSVAQDRHAIGYGGLASARGVRPLALRLGSGETIAPSRATVLNKQYPLSRPLYVYSTAAAETPTARFVAWMTGPEAQALAEEAGFFPVQTP
jgi:phosphate transport system substrate-binding protein